MMVQILIHKLLAGRMSQLVLVEADACDVMAGLLGERQFQELIGC